MSRQIPTITTPANGSGINSMVLRDNFNQIANFANDHDESHWPIKLSAPDPTNFIYVGTTGGALAAGSWGIKFTYLTGGGDETMRSSDFYVNLLSPNNAIQVTVPAVSASLTPKMRVYLTTGSGLIGNPTYRCGASNLQITVLGGNASIDTDGTITLNTNTTTTFIVKSAPTSSNPAAPATSSIVIGDPIQLLYALPSIGNAITTSTNQYTLTSNVATPTGQLTIVQTYDTSVRPHRWTTSNCVSISAGGITLARYNCTYGTNPVTGAPFLSSLVQQEA